LRTDQANLQLDFGPTYAPPPAPERPDGNDAAPAARKRARKLKAVPLEPSPAPIDAVAEGSAPVPAAPEPAPVVPEPASAPRNDHEVLVFDVETTGTDKRRDQVIELCMQFGLEGPSRTWRFRPSCPISPGAQAVHGISIEDLADCPTFAECAEEIAAIFTQHEVIVGYNLSFDIDMLQAAHERQPCRSPSSTSAAR